MVLDDYHQIDSESVHRIVSFLLERLPENTHLVISGRVDPPLPLTRLRVRDQMTELHAAELRFTPEEAAAFLSDVMGLDLSADDVTALEGVTEGWIAGLQLAALSMRNARTSRASSGPSRAATATSFDFLAEEVWRGSPKQCVVLAGDLDPRQPERPVVRRSHRPRRRPARCWRGWRGRTCFVVALDDERRWYRYHHLFADFLRGRLTRERPERLATLHLGPASGTSRTGLVSRRSGTRSPPATTKGPRG